MINNEVNKNKIKLYRIYNERIKQNNFYSF